MTLGAAILGCGLVGRKRAQALKEVGLKVPAVYDTDPDRAAALAAELAEPTRAVATPAAALERDDVDVAVVATTHAHLAELAGEAVLAGCHVLVEKPGARSAAELESFRRVATGTDRVVRVGYNHRFHPGPQSAKQLVSSGAYGEVALIRARYGHGGRLGYEREWRAEPSVSGGGELLDQGVHLIDLTRFLIGDVTLAFAELRTDFWPMQVEDNAFLALRGDAGGFAWLHASWTEWKNLFSFEISMRTARIDIDGLGGSYGTEGLTIHEMLPEMGPPESTVRNWDEPDRSWRVELEDFLGAVQGASSQGAGLDDALAVLRVVEEAYSR